MNPIDISSMTAQQKLTEIAKMVYGSGKSEGTSGGKGNIGMLNGRVVKFNTHWTERRGRTTNEMLESCNDLRRALNEIARALLPLADGPQPLFNNNSIIIEARNKICDELGLTHDGETIETTRLLDRKTVARVIDELSRAAARTGRQLTPWDGATQAADSLSSKNIDTHFSVVREHASSDKMVDDVLHDLTRSLPPRPTFSLTPQEANFMKTLVWRERSALLAAGKPLPSSDEFKMSVITGKSPAFVATMFTFDHCTEDLAHLCDDPAHKTSDLVFNNRLLCAYFSGAPEAERLDRAELFMTACNTPSNTGRFMSGSISVLRMCEKLPEMRRLQPEGRLTCETIWKACFNETLPKELRGTEGTSAFAEEMRHRTDQLAIDMIYQLVPDLEDDDEEILFETVRGQIAVASINLQLGITLEAFVKSGLQRINNKTDRPLVLDWDYIFNPSTDKVARGFLYQPDSAANESDETLRRTLREDFQRKRTIVRLVSDPQSPETVIDSGSFESQSDSECEARITDFMQNVDQFLGNVSRAQRNVLMFGFCQASMIPLEAMLYNDSTRSAIIISLERDSQDPSRIIISYQTADTAPVNVRYAFAVNANGSNIEIGEMSAEPRAS